jgi:hypothetical protein
LKNCIQPIGRLIGKSGSESIVGINGNWEHS